MWKRVSVPVVCLGLFSGCERRSAPPAAAEYAVEVSYPVRGDVDAWNTWTGRLVSVVSAGVVPQVSGYVRTRDFRDGQNVRKGDVLFRLDARQYLEEEEKAEHAAEEAAAELERAGRNVGFYAPLVKNGSVSRQTYVNALQEEKAARAARDSALAALALARTNVGYCTLVSPIDGAAGFAQAEVGDYVGPDSEPMVTVNQLDPIRVYFAVSEQDWLDQDGDAGSLAPGREVEVILANGRPCPGPALIGGVNNAVSTATGTLMMQADMPNSDQLLRPGMFVNVRARVASEKGALLVPQSALAEIQGKSFVVSADVRGKARLIPVETGLSRDGMVAVKGRLTERTPIVVSGVQQGMMAAEGRARLKVEMKGGTRPQEQGGTRL